MAFTYEPSTDRGKVRLLCYDIQSGVSVFSDAGIDAFLEMNSDSIWLAGAEACRVRSAKVIEESFNLELVGAIKLDKRKTAGYWSDLSKQYESRAMGSSDTVKEFWDSFDIDVDTIGRNVGEFVGDL